MIRRITAAGLLAAAWPAPAGAQEPAPNPPAAPAPGTEIRVAPDWAAGTVFAIARHKVRTDVLPGGRTRRFEHTTPATVEVLERRADGYQLRWTWGEAKLAGLAAESLLVRGITDLVAGVPLEIQVDDLGTPVRLANADAVAKALNAKAAALAERMRDAGVPDGIAAQIGRIRYRAGQVQGMLLVEPAAMLLASGGNFIAGRDQTYADQTGNPLGDERLPTSATFRLGTVTAQELTITWRQRLDAAAAGPILRKSAAARAERAGRPAPAPEAVPAVDVRDDAVFVLDRATAWPRRAEFTRVTVNGGRRRTEQTVVTLTRVTQSRKE